MSGTSDQNESGVLAAKVELQARPLRIGISTRALFALEEEHQAFVDDGLLPYLALQLKREAAPLGKGAGFEVVARLLALNEPGSPPYVEVVLLSRNAPDQSLRAFAAVDRYGLDIRHASFTSGRPLAPYVSAWGIDLFLSNEALDVSAAATAGTAAAKLGAAPDGRSDDRHDLRVAFDGDAVLFSPESDAIYTTHGLDAFLQHEIANATRPMGPGPFGAVLRKIASLRRIHMGEGESRVRIAVVTARSAPAHARVVHTLRAWGTTADEAHFVGGREKTPVLAAFAPHIFSMIRNGTLKAPRPWSRPASCRARPRRESRRPPAPGTRSIEKIDDPLEAATKWIICPNMDIKSIHSKPASGPVASSSWALPSSKAPSCRVAEGDRSAIATGTGDPSRRGRRARPSADAGLVAAREAFSLYRLESIRAALGMPSGEPTGSDLDLCDGAPPSDTEHQIRLGEILARGDRGRWRRAVVPSVGIEEAVARLTARAPHFAELGALVRMNLRAATNMCVPIFLAPVLLVGPPGVGKTWYLSRLAATLGVAFRCYAMNASTLGEGLQGAHPSWRNAAPGLVAKTLLSELDANPILFVDEFDKAQAGGYNADPYRPFYSLLDPSGSRAFVDEYLGFEIDASKILWVMAANDCTLIPAPILDRLTVLEVPDMTAEQRKAVIGSIHAEANGARHGFFAKTLREEVVDALAAMSPRSMRIAIDDAMARAAADGRRDLCAADVRLRPTAKTWRAGFR